MRKKRQGSHVIPLSLMLGQAKLTNLSTIDKTKASNLVLCRLCMSIKFCANCARSPVLVADHFQMNFFCLFVCLLSNLKLAYESLKHKTGI